MRLCRFCRQERSKFQITVMLYLEFFSFRPRRKAHHHLQNKKLSCRRGTAERAVSVETVCEMSKSQQMII